MKKTIIFIGSFPPPYHGSSIYLKNITELLMEDGEFDVISINCSLKNKGLSELGSWTFTNVYNALVAIIRLILTLIFKKIDIVYIPIAQNKTAFLRDGIAIILSKVFGKKVLIHLHGSYFSEFYEKSSKLYKFFIDLSMKSCNGVIVLGNKLRYIFEKWFDNSKIFVLPNFIKLPTFNLENSDLIGKEKDILNITYLGNIIVSKGIFQSLEAIKILLDKGFNIKFNIIGRIGKDPLTNTSEKDTENLLNSYLNNYKEKITYLEQITDVDKKFSILKFNTDIFLFPSWYPIEGQPLVILEAMSLGLPIISTKNCGVIEETVIDGYNGILVEKKNVDQLVEAIEKLVNNPELREKMGENSYKRYLENYTPEKHLINFKRIVNKIINFNG